MIKLYRERMYFGSDLHSPLQLLVHRAAVKTGNYTALGILVAKQRIKEIIILVLRCSSFARIPYQYVINTQLPSRAHSHLS